MYRLCPRKKFKHEALLCSFHVSRLTRVVMIERLFVIILGIRYHRLSAQAKMYHLCPRMKSNHDALLFLIHASRLTRVASIERALVIIPCIFVDHPRLKQQRTSRQATCKRAVRRHGHLS